MEPKRKRKRKRKHNRSRKNLAKKRDISGMNLTSDPRVCFPQSQSLFFKLPPELRRMIYALLVGRDRVHIWLGTGLGQDTKSWNRSRHCLCQDGDCGKPTSAALFRPLCEKHWRWPSAVQYEADRRNFYKTQSECFMLLPLAQTCRRMCSEAIDVLYAKTSFYFEDTELLDGSGLHIPPRWLHLIKNLETRIKLPIHSEAIQTRDMISFEEYQNFLDSISSIPSLKNVRLRVINNSDVALYQDRHWWKPISPMINEIVRHFNGLNCELFLADVRGSNPEAVQLGTCKIYGREEVDRRVRRFIREVAAYRLRQHQDE